MTAEGTTASAIAQDAQNALDTVTNVPTSASEAGDYIKNLINLLQEFAVTYGGKLIGAILILFIGFKLIKVFTKKLGKSKMLNKLDISTRGLIVNVLSAVLKIILAITALSILGVPMTSMVAVITSCGLAVGLALQGSLSNIAGGFILLVVKPFAVGDFIVSGDISGTVDDIGIFHTKIVTPDNKKIVVPNATISNATLTNVSALKERRVDLTFTASYDADISTVENTLLAVCDSHELIFKDPSPFARLSGHKDFALEYTVRVWCKTDDYWTVYFDLIRDVKVAFDKKGIAIPYPQLDVHNVN